MTSDGRLLSKVEHPTHAHRGPAAVVTILQELVTGLVRSTPAVRAVGLACAGQIHPVTGAVVYAPNLDWRDVPLRSLLADALGLPVVVDNDVRAAAWGEFRLGEHEARSLVAVFVGTGVGSGAVLDGVLWRGSSNAAGELGHTQVVPDGLPCPCGARGCLEQYASGSGFQRRLGAALTAGVTTDLADATGGRPQSLTADMVAAAAAAGDELARTLWRDATRYLTLGVANYTTLINPDTLVLGGGIVEAVPGLFDAVATGVAASTTVLARQALRVDRARLGDWSGVLGAAMLATAG